MSIAILPYTILSDFYSFLFNVILLLNWRQLCLCFGIQNSECQIAIIKAEGALRSSTNAPSYLFGASTWRLGFIFMTGQAGKRRAARTGSYLLLLWPAFNHIRRSGSCYSPTTRIRLIWTFEVD